MFHLTSRQDGFLINKPINKQIEIHLDPCVSVSFPQTNQGTFCTGVTTKSILATVHVMRVVIIHYP